jgi:hypothetical protein
MKIKTVLSGVCVGFILSGVSFGAAIVPGFNTTSDGRNDDGTFTTGGCNNSSSGGTPVSIGFTANFDGLSFNSLFINTNGNVTLDAPLRTSAPFSLFESSRHIIAPFFAHVDTRNPASGVVTFGQFIDGGIAPLSVFSLQSDVPGRRIFSFRDTQAEVVPEPGSLTLLGLGSVALLVGFRRRSS